MKIKRMIAASALAVILTGCQADTKPQISNTSGAASTLSATQTTPETTTVTTTAKTTTFRTTARTTNLQTTTAAPKPRFEKLTIINIERDPYNSDYANIWLIPVKNDYPSGTEIEVYHGSTENNMTFSEVHYYKSEFISVPCEPGDNYYKLRLTDYENSGEFSETIYFYCEPISDVHQYTHTFVTTGDGWTIVPDYTDAINELNNGIQPTKFQIKVYWTCPYCGERKGPYSYNLKYSEDSWNIIGSTGCLITSCPGHKDKTQCTVTSYAVQIS